MDDLLWLLAWFKNHCDGDWEHGHGVGIGTMNDPGWFIKVNLPNTEIENCELVLVEKKRSETDWVRYETDDGYFKGYGGVLNLPEMIKFFRKWVESND